MIISRKINASTSNEDPEAGIDNDSIKEDKIKNVNKFSLFLGRVKIWFQKYCWRIIAVQCIFHIMVIISLPAQLRSKIVNEELNSFSSTLYELHGQLASLSETAANLTSSINAKKAKLGHSMADMVGLVSTGHLEAELNRTKLEKQNEINELQLAITFHKKDLDLVKSQLKVATEAEEAVKKAQEAKVTAEKKAAELEKIIATQKAEEDRIAAEKRKAEEEKIVAEKKAEEKKIAAEKKAEEEKIAAEKKAEEDRIAAAKKAEEDRIVAEKKKAEEDRIAAAKKAEEDRIAAEKKKAEEEKIAAEKKAEEDRIAAEKKAEEDRIAAAKKAEEEKIVAEKKAEEERIAAEQKKAEAEEAAKKAEEEKKVEEAGA